MRKGDKRMALNYEVISNIFQILGGCLIALGGATMSSISITNFKLYVLFRYSPFLVGILLTFLGVAIALTTIGSML